MRDIPPVNAVPNFEAHSLQEPYNNNSMFYGHPQYHHQDASNLGPDMSGAPNYYLPYPAFQAPPSQLLPHGVSFAEQERIAHFMMGHGYKRKSAEVIPRNALYLNTAAAAPCSYPETAPSSFPQFGNYPQPLDQRSVRNRAGAATVSHGHNSFIQGNYAAHPFPPPATIWYDQHCNGSNRSDGSSSHWSQPPSGPYMHGNGVTGSIDSGNVYPGHNYVSHHPVPPPPNVYHHMAPASYAVPETMHDASYGHVGFRINQQHPQYDLAPAATLRHHGPPHFRGISANEAALLGGEDFYDDVNYFDHHQDMRLDIEDMSYEELLALSDEIGTVKTGLSEEEVKDLLKRRTSLSTRINTEEAPSTDRETDSCTICQENYKNKDKIATLDCKHEYHAECLKKWLVIKNVCPICKSEALATEKKKIRLSRGEEVVADST
ncbi:unnamed protein product [Thlaspi arvense]|uniref:RING-type E3 ubiquitin transferase n=1 Tax=Thlaspi arvense TaxID=13288 RepID=A0AAU9S2M6_THLAR|nr:unnamed protein product [Thlaspi arvense]